MPYEWVGTTDRTPDISSAASHAAGEQPLARLHAWPNRSLPKRGFVFFIAVTFVLLMLPMLAVLGTPVLWGLAPFVLGTLALVYLMLQKSYRDGEILEELSLWSDHASLTRTARNAPARTWEANPYWVSVQLHRKGGPVPSYLTLKGSGREVELGAFLSQDERDDLFPVLTLMLNEIVEKGARHGC